MAALYMCMHFNRSRAVVVVTLVFAASAFACSSAPPDSTLASDINGNNANGSSGNTVPKKTTGTTSTGGSNTAAPAPTTPTPAPTVAPDGGVPTPVPVGNGQCASSLDLSSCLDCCDPQNALALDDDAWDQCVCTSACAAQCGNNFCAGGPPTAACQQCLQADTACGQQADAACNANAACAAALACVQSSSCDAKP